MNARERRAQLEAERAREILEEDQYQREMIAQKNRAEDRAEPVPGSKLVVMTSEGRKVRGRAGIAFGQTPIEVFVIDASDDEVRERQRSGELVVNPWGAEQIIADSNAEYRGLIVHASMAESRAVSLEALSDEELEAVLAAHDKGER